MNKPLWTPSPESCKNSNISKFHSYLSDIHDDIPVQYTKFHQWTIANKAAFWEGIWNYFQVEGNYNPDTVLQNEDRMPGAKWFEGASLNFAQNLLRRNDDTPAIIACKENGERSEVSYAELTRQVTLLGHALRQAGVTKGDRIAGFLPNCTESVVAMLATTSLGAVWSSCSPDFGLNGVIDRFGQIRPKVLFVTNGYQYNGKVIDSRAEVCDMLNKLDSLEYAIEVPFVDPGKSAFSNRMLSGGTASDETTRPGRTKCIRWSEFIDAGNGAQETPLKFTPVAFSDPLYIMYSSGTTGAPKCIVHSVGGTLLQHLKELSLHVNLQESQRIFYYSTCGWMMWNWLVSSLALGSTIVLYDGSPFYPNGNILFDIAEKEKLHVFGSSAKFYSSCEKANILPAKTHNLEHLRTLLSTGSPLSHESFDYLYRDVKKDVCVSSISGGTDIISCFALGNPALPVYRGELQCVGLGMDVAIYDDDGKAKATGKGELVCQSPFPAMPTGFWNDPDGEKYRNSYFATWPDIWAHGDYGELIPHEHHNGVIIHGRSDAVLNPGGVRIGTAEIYRQVEKVNEVLESVAVGQNWQNDVRVILFVTLKNNIELDDKLKNEIKTEIRNGATPRHVPEKIIQVADIPRTISGKIVELAIRNIIHGQPVKNRDALANPEALAHFANLDELKT
ncbi:MAG: acetoacetate--CoA ligase [Proteobacteria bacterium]|nr:MAG: acetoacetate--CoA ligase [Pseudomonadota bacterium]